MKKLFILLSFLIPAIAGFSQGYPVTQNLGNGSTLVQVPVNGALRAFLINNSFVDTTAANNTNVKYYTGAQIFTTSDSSLWFRAKNRNGWILMAASAGGANGVFWKINGNVFPVIPSNFGFGTRDATAIPFMTNGVTRFTLPATGLSYSNVSTDSLLARDVSGNLVLVPKTTVGSTPTWQQTLIAGSTMSQTNYLDGASNEFHFDNFNGVYYDYFIDVQDMRISSRSNNVMLHPGSSSPLHPSGQGSSILIGRYSGYNGNAGVNIAIGGTSLYANVNTSYNIAIGEASLTSLTKGVGRNLAVGYSAAQSLDSGQYNTVYGFQALYTATQSSYNTVIGLNAMSGSLGPIGSFNTAVGHESMKDLTSGQQNVGVGHNSLWKTTTGIKNVAIGAGVMEANTVGSFNTIVGQDGMLLNKKGWRNTAIGYEPLGHIGYNASDSSNQNVAVGYLAGDGLYHGDNNVFLGYGSGYGPSGQEDSVTNSIALGYLSVTTASNQMVLGNGSLTDTRIFGVGSGAGTKSLRIDPATNKVTYADTTSYMDVVASYDATTLSSTTTNAINYTTPNTGNLSVYDLGCHVTVTAIAGGGVLTTTVGYTDETNTARTLTFYSMGTTSAGLTATGVSNFPTMGEITAYPNTAITLSTVLTIGTSTYNLSASLRYIRKGLAL